MSVIAVNHESILVTVVRLNLEVNVLKNELIASQAREAELKERLEATANVAAAHAEEVAKLKEQMERTGHIRPPHIKTGSN